MTADDPRRDAVVQPPAPSPSMDGPHSGLGGWQAPTVGRPPCPPSTDVSEPRRSSLGGWGAPAVGRPSCPSSTDVTEARRSAPAPGVSPQSSADAFLRCEADLSASAHGLLAAFEKAGRLGWGDIHVATKIAFLYGEADERVQLALALTVAALQAGSVCLNLSSVRDEPARSWRAATNGDDETVPAIPTEWWPDDAAWRDALRLSPLVAVGTDAPTGQPLRLVGDLLYLERYWRDETIVADQLLTRASNSTTHPNGTSLPEGRLPTGNNVTNRLPTRTDDSSAQPDGALLPEGQPPTGGGVTDQLVSRADGSSTRPDRALLSEGQPAAETDVTDDLTTDPGAGTTAPHPTTSGSDSAVAASHLAETLREVLPSEDEAQATAVAIAALSPVSVIAGGPGTGKTTTVARVLAALLSLGVPPSRIALAAPTGKAAARLDEAIGDAARAQPAELRAGIDQLHAQTIHRLLGWVPEARNRFAHNRANPLPTDVVIVDEASMVSLPLMARLLEALRPDARLVLVGDPDQLAPVEAGAVLADIVDAAPPPSPGLTAWLHDLGLSPSGPVVRLRTNWRFSGLLADFAAAVLAGDDQAAVRIACSDADHAAASAADTAPQDVDHDRRPRATYAFRQSPGGTNAGSRQPVTSHPQHDDPVLVSDVPPAEDQLANVSADSQRPATPHAQHNDPTLMGDSSHAENQRTSVTKPPPSLSPLRGTTSTNPATVVLTGAAGPGLETVRRQVVDAGLTMIRAARAGDAAGALDALGRHRLLCAHRQGPYGVARWTRQIEEWLAAAGAAFSPRDPWYPGRPLLVTQNAPDIGLWNGDTGVVLAGPDGPRACFQRGRDVATYSVFVLDQVETAYAMTVHKAQGSQFDAVTLVLPPPESPLLTRELLYTAVTRARSHVTVIGAQDALREAIHRRARRASGLATRLGNRMPTGRPR